MNENDQLEVLLHLPGAAARKIVAQGTTTIGELMREGGAGKDLLAFGAEEDLDQHDDDLTVPPLSLDMVLSSLASGRVATVHCHCCSQIRATVNYNSESLHRKFLPSTRARKVLRWAKRKLRLTDADADNLALFLCDGGEQVRENAHLGQLVTSASCEICFDLSKDRNIEGLE